MKIGLMGGTFDPPHKAHIELAKLAKREFSLDRIIFMTGGNPPHKTTDTDAKIRHHMMRLAIEGYEDFEPCDYELKKNGYSYTSDTLNYLKSIYPEDEIYFIIGGDSFDAILTWHEPEKILSRCTVLVYPRDDYPESRDISEFNKKFNSDVRLMHASEIDISSTDLREMIIKGEDISNFVDYEVWEYIKRNSLYTERNKTHEERLEELLVPSRYRHSLGVAATAVSMAGIFGADAKDAYIAGLLHDCAKNLTSEEIEIKCRDLEVEIDEFEKRNPALIHAKVGAEMVKTEFGINDEKISSAIRWHTIGRVNMTTLEKIIFVADMIEPSRNYPEVEALRQAAEHDLDRAVFECVAAVIAFNEKKGREIHPNAYKIYEEMKCKSDFTII